MSGKLSVAELHTKLLSALGEHVVWHSDIDEKPLFVQLAPPYSWKLKIYIYKCTNPPGARQAGECKSQLILPGQKRGTRGRFEISPDSITLLMGYARVLNEDEGTFILWELKKHMDFAYSANVQVSLSTLLDSLTIPLFARLKRGNGEWVVVCQPHMLYQAIKRRVDVDIEILLKE